MSGFGDQCPTASATANISVATSIQLRHPASSPTSHRQNTQSAAAQPRLSSFIVIISSAGDAARGVWLRVMGDREDISGTRGLRGAAACRPSTPRNRHRMPLRGFWRVGGQQSGYLSESAGVCITVSAEAVEVGSESA